MMPSSLLLVLLLLLLLLLLLILIGSNGTIRVVEAVGSSPPPKLKPVFPVLSLLDKCLSLSVVLALTKVGSLLLLSPLSESNSNELFCTAVHGDEQHDDAEDEEEDDDTSGDTVRDTMDGSSLRQTRSDVMEWKGLSLLLLF